MVVRILALATLLAVLSLLIIPAIAQEDGQDGPQGYVQGSYFGENLANPRSNLGSSFFGNVMRGEPNGYLPASRFGQTMGAPLVDPAGDQ